MTGFRPFFNPATGEWIEFTAVAEDSDGKLVRFSWRSVPGGAITGPLPELRGLMRRHIDLPGLRWHRITPEPTKDPALAPFRSGHDLFGDGSLVVLPTPGHTPGSISLLVRRPSRPPLLMVGDLTYDAHVLEAGHVPGVGNRRHLREATAMVNQMRQRYPGLAILPAHDPGAADRLAHATGQTPELASA
jgi:N-acyl homoserine lactone hydrolase